MISVVQYAVIKFQDKLSFLSFFFLQNINIVNWIRNGDNSLRYYRGLLPSSLNIEAALGLLITIRILQSVQNWKNFSLYFHRCYNLKSHYVVSKPNCHDFSIAIHRSYRKPDPLLQTLMMVARGSSEMWIPVCHSRECQFQKEYNMNCRRIGSK